MKLLNNNIDKSNISYQWILEALAKNSNCIKSWYNNNIIIDNINVTMFGGDKGFISDVWKVTLTNNENGVFSCILKIPMIPDVNLARKILTFLEVENANNSEIVEYPIPHEFLKLIHDKEIIFYKNILPNIIDFKAPKYLGSKNVIPDIENGGLLLELIDYKKSNLTFIDTLNEKQCLSVMDELIKLQSYSLSLPSLNYHGDMTLPLTRELLEKFSKDSIQNWLYFKKYIGKSIYEAYEDDIILMFTNLPSIYNFISGLYKNDPKNQKVLVHGDLWINNLLFNGDNIIGIIDYQEIHFNNLAYDITRLLVYCTSHDVRNSIINNKLNFYYDKLKEACNGNLMIGYEKFLECFDITFILQTIFLMKHLHFALYSCRKELSKINNWKKTIGVRIFHLLTEAIERGKKINIKSIYDEEKK